MFIHKYRLRLLCFWLEQSRKQNILTDWEQLAFINSPKLPPLISCISVFLPNAISFLYGMFESTLLKICLPVFWIFLLFFCTDQIVRHFTWFVSELHILLIMGVIWCAWFGLIYIIFWLNYILAFWPLYFFKGRR